jgi:hypothetical protein
MDYKIIKNFRDKITGEIHKVGDIISRDEKRGPELIEANVVETLNDGGPSDYEDKYPLSKEYLLSLTKKELKELLNKKNIDYKASALKKELIKLLQRGD